MSGKAKDNLLFFSLDCDFFDNKDIRLIKSNFGSDGIVLYLYLLTQLYGDKGYYLVFDDDYIDLTADKLNIKRGKIVQVVHFLVKKSLFNDILFNCDRVLSSHNIQIRYQEAVKGKARKRKDKCIYVSDKYWLLSPELTGSHIFVQKNNNGGNNEENGGRNEDNSKKYTAKEKKRNEDRLIDSKKGDIAKDIKQRLFYDDYIKDKKYGVYYKELVNLIIDTLCSNKEYINIDSEEKPIKQVKEVFNSLSSFHIEYVCETLIKNKRKIHNIKSYMLTCLYNAPFTIDSYYQNKVKSEIRI